MELREINNEDYLYIYGDYDIDFKIYKSDNQLVCIVSETQMSCENELNGDFAGLISSLDELENLYQKYLSKHNLN